MSATKKSVLGITILSLLALAFLVSCAGVTKMVSITTKLGREIDQLSKIPDTDLLGKVDPTVTWERIKSDPDEILGQYCSLQGIVDLQGSKDFPLNAQVRGNKGKEGTVFILKYLDYSVFVIAIEPLPWIKDGDDVVVMGIVSESRFLKEMSEMYPKEKIPDLVTIIAKNVNKSEGLILPKTDNQSKGAGQS